MLLSPASERGRKLAAALRGSWRSVQGADRIEVDRGLADLLVTHGCGGLGFRVADRDRLDPAALECLHDAYRWNALNARRQERDIAAAKRCLAEAGIEMTLGKGFAVARHYPGPGLRPCGDIDLYVAAGDAERAAAVLASSAPGIAIDLHRGCADLTDRDASESRRRTATVTVEAESISLFGFEDHLRLLCLHTARHGALRAMWLCDIALLAETLPEGFDVAYFSSGDPGRTDLAFRVLGLAHTLLGARLDRVGVDRARLLPPPWMESAVLSEWGRARTSHGTRRPWRSEMSRPWRWPRAVLDRWPNGLEAAHETGTPVDRGGSVWVQFRACLRRIRRSSTREVRA